ncbi:hypothetical protein CCMSSC00406_0007321 [Pleurotus cornucopiae]|uniref:Uncharacterized protein n=1 Tax=Pleurotus cornucopiae TaxID=5321 RepID=A0ACB7ILC1_PLECO|nr:hypothetical protein CCMSSC00406_0007321 [Pleurotus cornucopiae]
MKKSLTPPTGTLYHKLKRFNIYDDEVIASIFTLTWQAEIHVYVTGGIKPDDEDFEAKGGAIHVVVCHTGSLAVAKNQTGDLTFSCGVDDVDSFPYVHLPLTDAIRTTGDPKASSYAFEFKQTFQMLKGNDPLSYVAQYSDDFTLGYYTEYHTNLHVAALKATFRLYQRGTNAGSVTDHNVHGVSGFRLTKQRKQITMWFCIEQKGEIKSVTIDLNF